MYTRKCFVIMKTMLEDQDDRVQMRSHYTHVCYVKDWETTLSR